MQVNLSNEDTKIIITALVKMPWIEVNDLINKLTEPTKPKVEMLTLPVVDLPQTDAPYGLKKDGTPAKRRGRPVAKKNARKTRQ